MSKKRKPSPKNTNRLLLERWFNGRSGPDRLWDRDGRLWVPAVERLDEERTRELFFDVSVPVAVYEAAATLQWVEPAERRRRWPEFQVRTFDERGETPPEGPGDRPFIAQEWRSDDASLLLFDDFD